MQSIVEYIANYAKTTPEKIAVIAEDRQITYSELWKEIQGFAEYICSFNFPKGSRIIVKSSHSIWFAVACFAIHLSGNIHAPLEKTIGVKGLDEVAEQLDAAMVISDIKGENNYVYVNSHDVMDIGKDNFSEDLQFKFPTSDMTCDIMFTTGTTGKSKGVMESHRAVVAVSENVKYGAEIIKDNVYLVPAPINHASAIRKLYVSMLTGTTVVLMDGYKNIKLFLTLCCK